MRCSIAPARVLSMPAFLAFLPLLVAGCDKLKPTGPADDLSLLRSGSDKICVAPSVQRILRTDVLPAPDDLPTRFAPENRAAVIAAASITFSTTTLEGFNQAIARVSCTTDVTISVDQKSSKQFEISYDVAPSADAAGSIVVSAHVDDAKRYAASIIEYNLNMQSIARQSAADEAEANAARARLAATVTPAWVVGNWIGGASSPEECSNGQSIVFRSDATFTGAGMVGHWSLSGNQLHLVGNAPDRAIDVIQTITQADANSFVANTGTRDVTWRRCAQGAAAPPLVEGSAMSQPPATPQPE